MRASVASMASSDTRPQPVILKRISAASPVSSIVSRSGDSVNDGLSAREKVSGAEPIAVEVSAASGVDSESSETSSAGHGWKVVGDTKKSARLSGEIQGTVRSSVISSQKTLVVEDAEHEDNASNTSLAAHSGEVEARQVWGRNERIGRDSVESEGKSRSSAVSAPLSTSTLVHSVAQTAPDALDSSSVDVAVESFGGGSEYRKGGGSTARRSVQEDNDEMHDGHESQGDENVEASTRSDFDGQDEDEEGEFLDGVQFMTHLEKRPIDVNDGKLAAFARD